MWMCTLKNEHIHITQRAGASPRPALHTAAAAGRRAMLSLSAHARVEGLLRNYAL